MLQSVETRPFIFEKREHVLDCHNAWMCEGMYVNEINCDPNPQRQGYVKEVVDEKDGYGKIKVEVVRKGDVFLEDADVYVTEFEPSTNWCRALSDC